MMVVNRKRIAKNTLIQYVQVFVKMIVGLVSSRLVLQSLGASDYGLYNVVGGFIMMFTFISSAMSITTTRYLNYEMGKPHGDINRIFNISNVLHIITAVFFLILLELIGIIYIANYLKVAEGKFADAMFVFQISTITACIGITNVPYRSIFVAYEKFSVIAWIEIFISVISLLLVFVLYFYDGNALRFYTIAMSMATIISFVAYHGLSRKYWPSTIKWKLVKDVSLYKDQIEFSNWNLLGTASFLGRTQGTHIIINYFFGTVVNAAYAISRTVEGLVNVFSFSFINAAAPQITKSIGNGNVSDAFSLSAQVSRYSVLLMQIVVFPGIVELDYLLHLWLGDSLPEGAVTFSYLTLLLSIVSSTSCGLSAIVDGFGEVKWFKIMFSFIYFTSLIVGMLFFLFGFPAYSIIIVSIFMDIVGRVLQLYLLQKKFSFPVKEFILSAWTRPFFQFLILTAIMCFLSHIGRIYEIQQFITIFIMFIITVLCSAYIGLLKIERLSGIEYIRMRIRK